MTALRQKVCKNGTLRVTCSDIYIYVYVIVYMFRFQVSTVPGYPPGMGLWQGPHTASCAFVLVLVRTCVFYTPAYRTLHSTGEGEIMVMCVCVHIAPGVYSTCVVYTSSWCLPGVIVVPTIWPPCETRRHIYICVCMPGAMALLCGPQEMAFHRCSHTRCLSKVLTPLLFVRRTEVPMT